MSRKKMKKRADQRGAVSTPIPQAIVDRTAGVSPTIASPTRSAGSDASAANWFGPGNELAPLAPPSVAGRRFDYPTLANSNPVPRDGEPIGFRQLRALADSFDVLRLVIETRKDQLERLAWTIQPRVKSKSAEVDPRIEALTQFFRYPDREHGWDQWLRMLVEDMLVIDAAAIYPRRTKGGEIYALELIDGGTLKRILDEWGRTPLPPDTAYQQYIKGVPAVDYTTDEIFYLPRNVRTNRVYGYSPVEQVIMSVNIALRRQIHQLNYYTEGNVPEALIGVPDTWSVGQIREFQEYWDALLEGNLATRRHARFVPGDVAKNYVATKEAGLKDEYDEWLTRIVCYAFSVANQWAVKQMNRATAGTAQEQAEEEGLEPLKKWIKTVIDRLLTQVWGYPDLQLAWTEDQAQDPLQQAQVADLYLRNGTLTLNEVRADLGREPAEGGDVHLVYTAMGATPLDQVLKPPPPPAAIGHNGGPALDDESGDDDDPPNGSGPRARPGPGGGAVEKDSALLKNAADAPERPEMVKWRGRLEAAWRHYLDALGEAAARALAPKFGRALKKAADDNPELADEPLAPEASPAAVREAEAAAAALAATTAGAAGETGVAATVAGETAAPSPTPTPAPTPAGAVTSAPAGTVSAAGTGAAVSEAEIAAAVDAVIASEPTETIVAATAEVLADAARAGVEGSIATIGNAGTVAAELGDMVHLANPRAVAWAMQHAAELVAGIDETTRAALVAAIVKAERTGASVATLAKEIRALGVFDAKRATLIATHELAAADINGNLEGMRQANRDLGLKIRKRTILGLNENHCVACIANLMAGPIPLDEPFPSGMQAPPFHPRCGCGLVAETDPAAKGYQVGKLTGWTL